MQRQRNKPLVIAVRLLEEQDIPSIVSAFGQIGSIGKSKSLYERYLSEQATGRRTVLLALEGGEFAGYLTIDWQSQYPAFQREGIPEINDFYVLPRVRRRGIGTRLMQEAERRIAERSPVAGIGVGLYSDYGAAQRLYVLRGYVPDGRGLVRGHRPVAPGEEVTVDDSLAIYLKKHLV